MKSIQKYLALIILTVCGSYVNAQTEGVSIKTTIGPPHPSAMLDIESSSKGLLVPRVSLVGMSNGTSPILNPSNSLLVFNTGTALPKGYYYWEETGPGTGIWVKLVTSGSGSSLWSPIGSTSDIYYAAGKVRIGSPGLPAPAFALEVKISSGDDVFKFEGTNGYLSYSGGGGYYGSTIIQHASTAGMGSIFMQTYSDGKEGITLSSTGTYNSWTTVNYSEILAGGNNAMYLTSHDKVIIHSGKVAGAWVSAYFFNQDGTMTTYSDSTLKINVTTLPAVMSKIKQCRPVTYNWAALPGGEKMHGFIAQELERVFPELVTDEITQSGETQKTVKTINYIGLTSILLKAIQQQQSQIETQSAEFQAQLNALKERVLVLENK
jgi:hypothetical protein